MVMTIEESEVDNSFDKKCNSLPNNRNENSTKDDVKSETSVDNSTELYNSNDTIVTVDVDSEDENDNMDKMKIEHGTKRGQIMSTLDQTTFGEIVVTNSTNVRVGNTTTYKGPVTIKQFVLSNSDTEKELKNINLNNSPNVTKSNSSISPILQEYSKVKKWLWTWRCAALLCVFELLLVTTLVVIIFMLKSPPEFPETPNFQPDYDNTDIPTEDIRFIKRVEWGAQPPEKPPTKLSITPAPFVIISHTASEACYNQADCIQRVRLAQTMHIEGNKWDDIGYNFLVGGDGLVYVGRGWDMVGAHAFGYNTRSIGISCIGTFNQLMPTKRQLYALRKLISIGVENNKIASNYTILGHRQVSKTKSPGDVLYHIIKSWDHWAELKE